MEKIAFDTYFSEGASAFTAAQRDKKEGIWITYMLAGKAISDLNRELPVESDKTRLLRGEFIKADIPQLLEKISRQCMVSRAKEILGDELIGEIEKTQGIDISSLQIEELARYHQKGAYENIWKNGISHTITLTPFISLTSNIETAFNAAVNSIEIRKGIEMGVYTNEDGTPNEQFYQKVDEYVSKGYKSVIYIIDVPNSAIKEIEQISNYKISEIKGLVIKNSKNGYGENEYITLAIDPGLIKGVIVFTGRPYDPKEGDAWKFYRL